jgi:hypothetical protein
MPAQLPQKLPNFTGSGGYASGMRMLAERINRLIDCYQTLIPRRSPNVLTSHTSIGVIRKANAVGKTSTVQSNDLPVWL